MMKELIENIELYLLETLGVKLTLNRWNGRARLPIYLQHQYDVYEANVLGIPCLFLMDQKSEESTPASISKHFVQVKKKFDGEVIYTCERVASYNRKRLIEHKVPFVVPGNQLYLPPLGLDLREYFKALHKEVETLSPAAQACVLHILYTFQVPKDVGAAKWASMVASDLGYSKMTISRVFKELDGLNLVRYYNHRVKLLTDGSSTVNTESGEKLWDLAQDYFRSPVKKSVYVLTKEEIGVLAGLTALSNFSMLSEPKNRTVAVSAVQWKSLIESKVVQEINIAEPGAVKVEIWSYDPNLFAKNGIIGRLSLVLSLKDDGDERIQMALSEMMENYSW